LRPRQNRYIRETWLEEVCQGFVAPSAANKSYYRILLEELWPVGHGIPGSRVKEEELRESIERFRRSSSENISKLREYAAKSNLDPHDLLNQIVDDFFHDKPELINEGFLLTEKYL
jgi:hypothetical protein